MFDFEREPIWNRALDVADHISLLTKQISKTDQASLGEGLRRASVSIATNLSLALQAEERSHEAKYFIQITETNIYKAVSLLKICFRREYISFDSYQRAHDELESMAETLAQMYNRMEL